MRLLLLAAMVVLVAACGGDDGDIDARGTTIDPEETVEDVAGRASDAVDNVLKVGLGEREGSGQYGSATITRIDGDSSEVTLELFDGPGRAQYAAIYGGTCDDLGDVQFELNELNQGRSSTRVDLALDKLEASTLAVAVRQSDDPSSEITVCGELDEERAIGRSDDETSREVAELARRVCSEVPVEALEDAFGAEEGDVRELADELTRELPDNVRDEVRDACIEQLEEQR